jgi:hypothetical protein
MRGPTKVGNGDSGSDLEGFELVTKGELINSKNDAIKLLKNLNTQAIVGLGNLLPELENSKVYMTKKDISSKELDEMGAFHSGLEGLVYARTFAHSYAATRFFPASLKLNSKQLMALHIHEALHRSLPDQVHEDEQIVSKITLAIITPEQTADNIQAVVKENIPDLFMPSTNHLVINKNSRIHNPSLVEISVSKWTESKRVSSLPIDHSLNVNAQLFIFGESNLTSGFGISSNYLMTKNSQNYFGPLELTYRNLFYTNRGYDLEFKIGYQIMSTSNSKVINSAYGKNAFIIGINAKKLSDKFNLKLSGDLIGGNSISRNINSISTQYEIGSTINLGGELLIPQKSYELGAQSKLIILNSLNVTQNNNSLLNKESDQYFSAGPVGKYHLNPDIVINLYGEYLFNSNKNSAEDHLRDLLGNGLGQWKWTTGVEIDFL